MLTLALELGMSEYERGRGLRRKIPAPRFHGDMLRGNDGVGAGMMMRKKGMAARGLGYVKD